MATTDLAAGLVVEAEVRRGVGHGTRSDQELGDGLNEAGLPDEENGVHAMALPPRSHHSRVLESLDLRDQPTVSVQH